LIAVLTGREAAGDGEEGMAFGIEKV